MAQPFVGEIRMFGGNFAPAGWAFCDGRLQPISQNGTLFALIGTTYGGDGQSTFGLPDLRGRLPVHQGAGLTIGQMAGAETTTITETEIPSHSHQWLASSAQSSQSTPIGNVTADTKAADANVYGPFTAATPLDPAAVGSSGGSQPHENRMPFLCVSFIISLFGIFPSRN
jgi:microcystin-dependent protein